MIIKFHTKIIFREKMKKGKKMNVAMIADNLDLNGISTVIVNY